MTTYVKWAFSFALSLFFAVAAAQPVNDSICNAITLPLDGSINCYDASLSTNNNGEPSYSCGTLSAPVWFRFQAPASGSVTISTDHSGTTYNTVLALYVATNCSSSPTEVGCNDDGSQDSVALSSDLTLSCLIPSANYFVLVDDIGGNGTVCISAQTNAGTSIGANSSCGFHQTYSSGFSFLQTDGTVACYTNVCANAQTGEPTGSNWSDGPQNSIWAVFSGPASGVVEISTSHSGTSFSNQIAVYRNGCPIMVASEVGSDEGSGSFTGTSKLTLCGLNTGLYWVQIDGVAADTGDVCISVTALFASSEPSGPDLICNADTIHVDSSAVGYNNICATAEVGEVAGSNWLVPVEVTNSTWHVFVAPVNGNVTISTDHAGTNFDTEIAVYASTGTCADSLVEVGSDADSGTGSTSSLSLTCLTPGNVYYIQVDGDSGAVGEYEISVTPDAGGSGSVNNDPCSAVNINVDGQANIFVNTCATTSGGEPSASCYSLDNTTYLTFGSPLSGSVDINFTNTTFDLEFSVFLVSDTNCLTANVDEVYCDNSTLTNPSVSLACLEPSSLYIIQVDGLNGQEGSYSISISDAGTASLGADQACSNALFEVPLDGSVNVFTNTCADTTLNEVFPNATTCMGLDSWCPGEATPIQNTIWFSFTAPGNGTIKISTDNDSTNFDTQIAIWNAGDCQDFSSYEFIAANDNCPGGCSNLNGSAQASSLEVCIEKGQYLIQVDGYAGATGSVGISAEFSQSSALGEPDYVLCALDTATLVASGAVSYQWSIGDTTPSIELYILIDSTVTVTMTDSAGCMFTDTTNITINYNLPTLIAGPDTTVCKGADVTLFASGGVSYVWSNGDTGSTTVVSNIINKAYKVTATGVSGCTISEAASVLVYPSPPADAGNDTTVCIGDSATLVASGGISYIWSTGETSNNITVAPSLTDYEVTVTDNNGCTASDGVSVAEFPETIADAGDDTTVCIGTMYNLLASGGINFIWSTGDTTANVLITVQSDTSFSVTVSDGNCIDSDTVNITSLNTPTVNATGDTTICPGQTVALTASGTGGFVWSTGDTGSVINVTPQVTTEFIVQVGNGSCADADTVKVMVLAAPTAGAGSDTTICQGENVKLTASGLGSYVWSNGQASRSITVSPDTTTFYSVLVTNASGCTDRDSVLVIVKPFVPSAGPDQVICPGGSTTLTATGGISYLWNTSDTTASINVMPLATMDYIVTVTAANGCVGDDTVSVSVNVINVDAGNDTTICDGESITLTATAGDSYQWNSGQATQSITVSPSSDFTYKVTVTSSSGCGEDSVQVTVLPGLTVGISSDTIVCPGSAVTLTASGGTDYLWTTGDMTASIVVAPVIPTTYSVIVSDGVCTSTASVMVSFFPDAFVSLGNDTSVCLGDTIVLSAAGSGSIQWSTGDTTNNISVSPSIETDYIASATSNDGCSSQDTITVSVNTLPTVQITGDLDICFGETTTLTGTGAGNYEWNTGATTASINESPNIDRQYSVIGFDQNGCSDADSVVVTVNSLPMVDLNDTVVCPGASATFNAGNPGASFTWSTGSSLGQITVDQPDSYHVTVTNSDGCSAADTASLGNYSPLIVMLPDTGICTGTSITLDLGNPGASYQWSTGATTQTISVNTAGDYIGTVTDGNGCETSDTGTVIVYSTIPVTISGDMLVCLGDDVSLQANGGNSYQWNNGESTGTITYTAVQDTAFTVVGADVNGCTGTATIDIGVQQLPTADAGTDQSICEGESATLTGSGGQTYLWSTLQTSANIQVSPSITTDYELQVFDNIGCTDVDSVTVDVFDLPTVTLSGLDTTLCINSGLFTLAGGLPTGGTYSGNGVTGSDFNPLNADTGNHDITYSYIDSNGCSGQATAVITVDRCTGIEVAGLGHLTIYPNPFNEQIILDFDGVDVSKAEIQLTDLSGRVLLRHKFSFTLARHQLALETSSLPEGIYFISVIGEQNFTPVRLVKIK